MNRWNKGYEEVWCRRQVQICCWIAVTVDKGSRRVKFYQISEVVPIVIVFHFVFVVMYLYMNDDHRWQRQALGKTLSDHTSTCTYQVPNPMGTCVCQGYFNVYFFDNFQNKISAEWTWAKLYQSWWTKAGHSEYDSPNSKFNTEHRNIQDLISNSMAIQQNVQSEFFKSI